MATERLLRPTRVGGLRGRDTRQADSLVQIISILGARRRELKASAGERLRVLDERASASESRHVQLGNRLSGIEGGLEQFDRAQSQRTALRGQRIVHLRRQVEILRRRAGVQGPDAELGSARAPMHKLGSVLMYVGGLLVVWVVLLELGLALGLT